MKRKYTAMNVAYDMNRREFVRSAATGAAIVGAGMVLGVPSFGAEAPPPVETNIAEFLKVPRTKHSLPGAFPGRVVRVGDPRSLVDEKIDAKVVRGMVERGIRSLTGRDLKSSFAMFFEPGDVVGIKVNPVGPPLIHTKPEVTDAVIRWLVDGGLPKKNIVIWDRFDYMLKDAGYTRDRFPGVRIEGLQTMDEEGDKWRDAKGRHVSEGNFDQSVFYFAKGIVGSNVRGYKDDTAYHNQHVFTGERSFFGNLLTQRLTKVVNLAAYKNTGNGISMATKNLGYGSLCNTGRLHERLFFNVNTEVLAAPVLRDKLVLNVTDGLRAQYEGGPDKNEGFVYSNHALYFATDPFALDMFCHRELVAKRKAAGITVNEHPRYTEYLRYAERLGLGVVDPAKMAVVRVEA